MYNSGLKALICVADRGSFRKAAEDLSISSTAVIKQINSLEEHLGMKLFERTAQGVTLTSAGEIIYKNAKKIIRLSDKAVAEASAEASNEVKILRIGTSMLNPCKPFMDIWSSISEEYQDYRLHLIPYDDDHTDILSVIESVGSRFDFLIGACDSKSWLSHCNLLRLGEYKFCCCVARNHRLAKKELLSIEDLYDETIMIVKEGDSGEVDVFRKDMNEKHPRIKLEDTPQFYDLDVFNQCERSQKVLISLECWKDVHPSLVSIPVDWDYALPYGIMYSLESRPEIIRIINAVQKQCI